MHQVIDTCKVIGARLRPDYDLLSGIQRIAKENNIRCGVIVSLVGSLKKATIRSVFDMKLQHLVYNTKTGEKIKHVKVYDVIEIEGPLEIVSVTGTISENASAHVHVVLSKGISNIYAGHLMKDSPVYTTVEMFILIMPNIISKRILDPETGHKELMLERRESRSSK